MTTTATKASEGACNFGNWRSTKETLKKEKIPLEILVSLGVSYSREREREREGRKRASRGTRAG